MPTGCQWSVAVLAFVGDSLLTARSLKSYTRGSRYSEGISRVCTGQQIKDAQKRWRNPEDSVSSRATLTIWTVWRPTYGNLCRIAPGKAFEEGGGGELKDGWRPAKMKALHSSSALAVNFFDYWTTRDKASLLKAMGIDGDSAESLCFEAKFPTSLSGQPPNLYVATKLCSGNTIGIESKFTEWMTKKTKATKSSERFAEKYFPYRLWSIRSCRSASGLPRKSATEYRMASICSTSWMWSSFSSTRLVWRLSLVTSSGCITSTTTTALANAPKRIGRKSSACRAGRG